MSVAIENLGHNLPSAHMNPEYMGPSSNANQLAEQTSLPTPKKSPKSRNPRQRRSSRARPRQENSTDKVAVAPSRTSVSEQGGTAARGHRSLSDNNPPNKRKNSNLPKNNNTIASTPGPKPHHSSGPEVRTGMTPRPASGTPSQAYAGPTFHASPAASSLPMPRFFAKKMQKEETAASSETSRQESTSEESSEKSDNSPTMRLSHQVSGDAAKDVSPLDIFFNADRRDKARRESSTPLLGRPVQSRAESNSISIQTPASPQPFFHGSTHHARHFSDTPLNHSISKVMGDIRHTESGSSAHNFESAHSHRSITSPSALASDPNSEEELKRKSMSLKNLLMSPNAQAPFSTSRSASASPFQGLQTPTPQRRPQPQTRSASGSNTPSSFSLDGTSTPPPTLQYGRRPSYQQGQSSNSHLRRQVVHDTASDGDVMPPSPTPFRTGYHPTILKNPRHNRTTPNLMPLSPVSPGFQQPETMDRGLLTPRSNNELMEETLRKILKLDVIGSDGANGVRI